MFGFSWIRWKTPNLPQPTELLDSGSHGAIAFKARFADDYRIFSKNVHYIACGKKSPPSSYGGLIAGTVIAGVSYSFEGLFALLALLGVLSAGLSLGLGFAAGIIGILGGLAFTVIRNKQKQNWYQQANEFIKRKNLNQNINHVMSKIAYRFSDYLNHCTSTEAKTFAREVMHIISHAIIHGKVNHLSQLLSEQYMQIYSEKLPKITTYDTKDILRNMQKSPVNDSDIIDNVSHAEVKYKNNHASQSRFGFFGRRKQYPENQPEYYVNNYNHVIFR